MGWASEIKIKISINTKPLNFMFSTKTRTALNETNRKNNDDRLPPPRTIYINNNNNTSNKKPV